MQEEVYYSRGSITYESILTKNGIWGGEFIHVHDIHSGGNIIKTHQFKLNVCAHVMLSNQIAKFIFANTN